MDTKLLGQRIKEARLSKKMTQSEVVGSFITRNMLSQIESGNAVPSMKTLTYLAKVLELPLSALLQDMPEETAASAKDIRTSALAFVPQDALTFYQAKEAYQAKEDFTAYSLLCSLSETSLLADEACGLFARVSLRLASTHFEAGAFLEALDYAKRAGDAASKGLYASLEVKSKALLLLSDAATKLAQKSGSVT